MFGIQHSFTMVALNNEAPLQQKNLAAVRCSACEAESLEAKAIMFLTLFG